MAPTKLVKAAIFTALAIGSGYALMLVPNVELITILVFSAGLWLGALWGLLVGGTAMFIFSVMHPFGSGLLFPLLLVAQVFTMAGAGCLGGILRPLVYRIKDRLPGRIFIAVIGGLITFIYDSLTTLSYPVAAGYEWKQTLIMYSSGIWIYALHMISNPVIFFIGIPQLLKHAPSDES